MSRLAKIGGPLTPMEARFCELYASTQDKRYAAKEAGYAYYIQSADKLLRTEKILREITRLQDVRMRSEIVPLAVNRLAAILRSDTVAAGSHVSAIRVALDYVKEITGEAASEKDPAEMTAEEIAASIALYESVLASRARDVTPASDQASSDQASSDQASSDQASSDQASSDQASDIFG